MTLLVAPNPSPQAKCAVSKTVYKIKIYSQSNPSKIMATETHLTAVQHEGPHQSLLWSSFTWSRKKSKECTLIPAKRMMWKKLGVFQTDLFGELCFQLFGIFSSLFFQGLLQHWDFCLSEADFLRHVWNSVKLGRSLKRSRRACLHIPKSLAESIGLLLHCLFFSTPFTSSSDSSKPRVCKPYCWWKRSCTSWYVVYPIIYQGVLKTSQVAIALKTSQVVFSPDFVNCFKTGRFFKKNSIRYIIFGQVAFHLPDIFNSHCSTQMRKVTSLKSPMFDKHVPTTRRFNKKWRCQVKTHTTVSLTLALVFSLNQTENHKNSPIEGMQSFKGSKPPGSVALLWDVPSKSFKR